jgi:hypothetical protein
MFSLLKKTGFSTKELSEAGQAGHSVLAGFRIKMRVVNSLFVALGYQSDAICSNCKSGFVFTNISSFTCPSNKPILTVACLYH